MALANMIKSVSALFFFAVSLAGLAPATSTSGCSGGTDIPNGGSQLVWAPVAYNGSSSWNFSEVETVSLPLKTYLIEH